MKKLGPEYGLVFKVGVESNLQRPNLLLVPKPVRPSDVVTLLIFALFPHHQSERKQVAIGQVRLFFFFFPFTILAKIDSSTTQCSNSLDPCRLHPKQSWCCCFLPPSRTEGIGFRKIVSNESCSKKVENHCSY